MKAFDEYQKNVKTDEPIFRMSAYGRTVNLKNETALAELTDFKKSIGENTNFPLGDDEYLKFEIAMSRKYKEEFKAYVKTFGGLRIAAAIFRAASMPSNLLDYWAEERIEKNGKAVISRPERLEESAAYSA